MDDLDTLYVSRKYIALRCKVAFPHFASVIYACYSYNGWSILKKWQIKSNQDCGDGTPGPRFLSHTLDSKSAVRDLSGSLTT